MKVISLASFKGGTGKTLITFNVAGLLAKEYDKKILLIDADPQHNTTSLVASKHERGIEDILQADINNEHISSTEVIQESYHSNIDILTSSIKLIKADTDIATTYGKEFILSRWIERNKEDLNKYDYIFIDTNPTMSTTNINAFLASDSIVLITDIDIDSLTAIDTFTSAYYPIQYKVMPNQENNIKGIIVNKLKETTNIDKEFIEFIESDKFIYSDIVLRPYLHETVALKNTKVSSSVIGRDDNKRAYNELKGLIDEMKERDIL